MFFQTNEKSAAGAAHLKNCYTIFISVEVFEDANNKRRYRFAYLLNKLNTPISMPVFLL